MSERLAIERQKLLEPQRIELAKKLLAEKGFKITYEDSNRIEFFHKDQVVKYWPYSGWHSGKSIKDGRGMHELLKKLE